MFKVNNCNARSKQQICSGLKLSTSEWPQWSCSDILVATLVNKHWKISGFLFLLGDTKREPKPKVAQYFQKY